MWVRRGGWSQVQPGPGFSPEADPFILPGGRPWKEPVPSAPSRQPLLTSAELAAPVSQLQGRALGLLGRVVKAGIEASLETQQLGVQAPLSTRARGHFPGSYIQGGGKTQLLTLHGTQGCLSLSPALARTWPPELTVLTCSHQSRPLF